MAEFPIVDIHTHMFRTPQIGRQALGGFRHGQAPAIEYFGLPEDHLAGMREADVAYCSALAVTPTREMRERALRERGPYGTEQWESNSGLTLDDKLLRRMDHNNAWGCWVGQKFPEIIPFIMVDPRLMAGDQLASYVQNRWDEGARGVKLLNVQTHHHADDRRLFPMYEFMQSINMPLFAQTGGGYGMGQNGISINPVTGDVWGRPRQFRRTLETFPRLKVIMAHALGGYNNTFTRLGDVAPGTSGYAHVFATENDPTSEGGTVIASRNVAFVHIVPDFDTVVPPSRYDVAIVGAGYTGLWTAYYLRRADPSVRVAVLEREVAGFGASGRKDRKSTRLNSSHMSESRMPSSA